MRASKGTMEAAGLGAERLPEGILCAAPPGARLSPRPRCPRPCRPAAQLARPCGPEALAVELARFFVREYPDTVWKAKVAGE